MVQSLYPTSSFEDLEITQDAIRRRANVAIREVNRKLVLLCTMKKIVFIDTYHVLIDHEGKLNPAYTRDGLHLNSEGYRVVLKELTKHVHTKKSLIEGNE
jgi:lysophospholipase L1-like esterase